MNLLSTILFAMALSMDGFGVGIAYGMRKIKVPTLSLLIVSLTSATAIGTSMVFGNLVSRIIAVETAEKIGSALLILIGLWIIFQSWPGKQKSPATFTDTQKNRPQESLVKFRIPPLGIIIQILRDPMVADADQSGYISARESLVLGLALAMDALGAGFGAAMTGFKPLLTPLVVGVVKFILVSFGVMLGRSYLAQKLGDKAAILPGWVLVFLGMVRVMKI